MPATNPRHHAARGPSIAHHYTVHLQAGETIPEARRRWERQTNRRELLLFC